MKISERAEQSQQLQQPQQGDIDIEYEFSQSPAQVWRMLSEPELLAQWLLPNDIVPEVGRCFSLGIKTLNKKDLDKKGADKESSHIECEVLASEPQRLLSYSWRTDRSGGDLDTVLTFILTETASGGTYLRLIHSGFPRAHSSYQPALAQIAPLPHRTVSIQHSAYEVKLLWAA